MQFGENQKYLYDFKVEKVQNKVCSTYFREDGIFEEMCTYIIKAYCFVEQFIKEILFLFSLSTCCTYLHYRFISCNI